MRVVTPAMAKVIDRIQQEGAALVTIEDLAVWLESLGVGTPVTVFAARMRDKGWFAPTRMRGVWRFLSEEGEGSSSPLLDVEAFARAHPDVLLALGGETAMWRLGFSVSEPVFVDVCFPDGVPRLVMPNSLRPHAFTPVLPLEETGDLCCLSLESAIVDIAARPQIVDGWERARSWLPEVAYDADVELVVRELEGRPSSVTARTGYLLQGLRPDIAEVLQRRFPVRGMARFGSRARSLRNDPVWQISDTVLPFDPRTLPTVR